MLVLCLDTQCLYSERVLGEGDPPTPDPLPLELWSMLIYYVYLMNYYTMNVLLFSVTAFRQNVIFTHPRLLLIKRKLHMLFKM
jgi:hypothetical protein